MLLQHSAAQQNGVDVQLLVEQHDIREPSRFERAVVVFDAEGVFVPNQKRELALLDKKKNRHASMPNPSNLMAVEDIKRVHYCPQLISKEYKLQKK